MLTFAVSLAAVALAGVNVAAAPVLATEGHLPARLAARREHTFRGIRRAASDDESSVAPEFNSTVAAFNGSAPINCTELFNATDLYNASSSLNSTCFSNATATNVTGYWSSQGASTEEEEEEEEECDEDDDDDEETCPEGYESVYTDDDDEYTSSVTASATATEAWTTASATVTASSTAATLEAEVQAAAGYSGHHRSSHSHHSSSSSAAAAESSSTSSDDWTTATITSSADSETWTATSTSSSAPASSSSSGSGSGSSYSGIATYFTQNGNAGACGNYNSDSTYLIAVRPEWYGSGENCGKTVSITAANGVTITATVQDECPSCDSVNSIDMSTGLWDAFGYPTSDGTFDMSWTCEGCTVPSSA